MAKKPGSVFDADESFECQARAHVWAQIDEKNRRLAVGVGFQVKDAAGRPIVAPSGHYAETPPAFVAGPAFTVALDLFDSEEKIREFVRGVRDRFAAFGPLLLAEQGATFLRAGMELQLGVIDPEYQKEADAKFLSAEHLERSEKVLRVIYGLPPRAKRSARSKWTKEELAGELREIGRQFGRGARPTFQDAAELFNSRNPERRVKDGEVLRKLCDRLGVAAKKFRNRGGKRDGKSTKVLAFNRNKS